MNSKPNTVGFINPPFFGTPCTLSSLPSLFSPSNLSGSPSLSSSSSSSTLSSLSSSFSLSSFLVHLVPILGFDPPPLSTSKIKTTSKMKTT